MEENLRHSSDTPSCCQSGDKFTAISSPWLASQQVDLPCQPQKDKRVERGALTVNLSLGQVRWDEETEASLEVLALATGVMVANTQESKSVTQTLADMINKRKKF
jgi:hypothetical protein